MKTFFKEESTSLDPELARSRVMTFRYFLMIVSGIFLIETGMELMIDFKATALWVFIVLTAIPAFMLGLSYAGVRHRILLTATMVFILFINQIQILNNPTIFHVQVYWMGLTPLLVAVLMNMRATLFWTVVIFACIIFNGLYVSGHMPSYTMTLYPERFMYGGLFFCTTIATVAVLFSYAKYKNHKRLADQNQTLKCLAREVEEQNKLLKEQHEEIMSINTMLEESNQHLEERVNTRTEELKEQNRKLTEYAFINSHLLRGPLSRILGIANLVQLTELSEKERELISHLNVAAGELDDVISRINKAIDSGHTLDRETIRKMKQ